MTTLYITGGIFLCVVGAILISISLSRLSSFNPNRRRGSGLFFILGLISAILSIVLITRPMIISDKEQEAVLELQHEAIENEWDTYEITGIKQNIVRGDDHFFVKHKDGTIYSIHAPYDEDSGTVTIDNIIDTNDNAALYDEYVNTIDANNINVELDDQSLSNNIFIMIVAFSFFFLLVILPMLLL